MASRISQLEQLLAETPGDEFLQHALGLEYQKIGDYSKAITIFEVLLNSSPDYLGTYYQLAKLFERTGNTEKAKVYYQRGMELANKVGDQHSYSELCNALEDMEE